MSESKQQEAEDRLRSRPVVDVTAVEISPNPAPLTDELNLEVDFHLDAPVANGVWDIEYLVDSVQKRHIINILSDALSDLHMPCRMQAPVLCHCMKREQNSCLDHARRGMLLRPDFFACCVQLGRVEAADYAKGDNHFQFSASEINVAGIQPSQLTNCGLLIAAFKDDDGDILDLKMVIQVSEQRSGLQRIIYSPLE